MAIPLIDAGASLLGDIFGGLFSSDAEKEAAKKQQQALQQILGLSAPELRDLQLEMQAEAGRLSPEAEGVVGLGPSRMEGVQADPALRSQQMQALSSLSDLGRTGMTAEERGELNRARLMAARDQQARQQAILQSRQARGMGGSGDELAAQLLASQAGAEQASQEGDRLAAQAQNRALQAISQAGNLAGNLRSQDVGEQSDKARAADIIAQFNAANQQSVGSRNVSARNEAERMNLQNLQNIMNQNVGTRNAQQEFNRVNLVQKRFENQRQLAEMKAKALSGAAGQDKESAQNTRDSWSGIGKGVGGIIGAFGNSAKNAPLKTNVDEETASPLLNYRGRLS
jgi:hypothetical protein